MSAELFGPDLQEHSHLFVARARERKAEQMAFLCWASDIRSNQVREMNAGQWHMLALAAGTSDPSVDTQMLVLKKLLEYEGGKVVAA